MYTPTKAIVLRSIRYSEADLIAKCYTASDGLKSYMLKGVLKSKKGRVKAAMFQPFTLLEIIARHKNTGRLEYIKEAKLTAINPSIRSEMQKTSMAIFLSEVIQNAVQEEEKNAALFHFLETSITWLETNTDIANFHLFFLIKLTKYLGIYPQYQNERELFFNLRQGYFELDETDNYSIGGQNANLLKTLLQLKAEELTSLKLNREIRQKFLLFILSYYQIQLQGFRQPKSLEVLNQLFV
ncbi:MAG TPA: DNA repair protein RecO [Flavobacteriaceae bacterium]|nr:DNA repair protein RecO [Flavobacteriaceae bacterium]